MLPARRQAIEAELDAHRVRFERALPFLSLAETHVLHHQRARLQAELEWLDTVIADLPAILTDEQSRKAS